MDVEKLKQKILDLAIRGKLVPQDPDDEPASVLIEKTRAEKENLIKQGKIKRDKNESYIFKGDDNSYYEKVSGETKKIDVPFAIPESWSWARLSSLCNIKGGKRIPKGFSFSTTPTKHIYIRVTDMKCQSIDISDLKYISDEVFEQIKQYTINDSDVYVSIAGTIGKVGTIPHMLDGMSLTENAVKLCNIQIDKDWLVTVLSSDFGKMKMVDRIHQVAQPKLSIISLSNTLIPIPPIEEQRRIHQQIKKTVSKLSLIASALSDIKELGTKLKYEILNYFFGDNSRYKSYSENMKDLGVLVSGRDLTPDCYNSNNNGIPYLTGASNFENDTVIVNRWTPKPVVISYFNDVLITCKGTIGKTAINQIGECHIARQIMAFRCGEKLFPEYVKMYFDYRTQELQRASSSLIPGISRDVMLNMEIPVPEIETQIQIVSRIKSMFALLGKIDS